MDKALLDTDIFSEILKAKNRQVVFKSAAYRTSFGQYTISTITILEIVKGFHKVGREIQIQTFLAGLGQMEVLSLNAEGAELAGRIQADLERTGQPIG